MSTPDKPDPAKAWKYVDNLLADEELERLEKLSPEEAQEELRAEGVDPARIPSAEQLLAKAEERAAKTKADGAAHADRADAGGANGAGGKVVPLRTRAPLYAALAVAAAVVLFFALRPHEGPVATGNPEAIRADAFKECSARQWDACERHLDEAKKIDANGESDPRVTAARRTIAEARRRDMERGRPAP